MPNVKPLKVGSTGHATEFQTNDTIDPAIVLKALPSYVDDAAAIAGGLSVGDFYVVAPGNDAIPAGIVKKIL